MSTGLVIPSRRSGSRLKFAAEVVKRPRINPVEAVLESLSQKGWRKSETRESKGRAGAAGQVFLHKLTNPSFTRKALGHDPDLWAQMLISPVDAVPQNETVRIRLGLFDTEADDTLVVGMDTSSIGKLSTTDDVENQVKEISDAVAEVYAIREAMAKHIITPQDCLKMATKAIKLRTDETDGKVKPSELLMVDGEKVEPKNLWEAYRLIRVNLLDGNYHIKDGARYARNITSILPELSIGEALWAIAEETMTAKAGK